MRGCTALLLLLLVVAVAAHELCLDTSGPINAQNTFCSGYNSHTCCSAEKDASIAQLHASLDIGDPTCSATMAALLCAECDPWGAHIFGTELHVAKPGAVIPYLCPDYLANVYTQCAAVNINWPDSTSPFGGNVMQNRYPNVTDFCNDYCAPSILGTYCFSGAPYRPTAINPNFQGQICLTHWAASPSGEGIWMQDPEDGTLLTASKTGEIRRHNRSTGADLGSFITIPDVYDNGESGLLSFALHPSFAANGRFFVYHSQTMEQHPVACTTDNSDQTCGKFIPCVNNLCQANHVSVVAEFKAINGNSIGDPASKKELWFLVQPYGNHNGGLIMFDPEGHLMIFLGDGGDGNDPGNRAQNLDSAFGKILRIDIDSAPAPGKAYAIPATNPGLSTVLPEVFAYGLRNPWRASYDAADPTKLIVADVGQDMREEVDIVVKGGNYGWRKYEGLINNPQYLNDPPIPNVTPPIFDYSRAEGTAVIGGYIYRGTRDLTLSGRYVFGDHSSGFMVATKDANDAWTWVHVSYLCGGNCPSRNFQLIFSFFEDANRDVYLLGPGGIFRIAEREVCGLVDGNSTVIPTATATLSTTGAVPTTAATTATASTTSTIPTTTATLQPSTTTGSPRSTAQAVTTTATTTTGIIDIPSASTALLPLAGLCASLVLFAMV